ncbi:MAG: Quercetin 2,3-dioxygenase [Pseudomonadota bacterium]|jgi:redox-sensitive bicupin YhaK (pirin superfamily)
MSAKTIVRIDQAPARHWVGNGFHVHGMFSYNRNPEDYSPFLMLDYAAPTQFAPNAGKPRGVGEHPHRGFETVTICYSGEVAHRDSSGGGGVIGVGDVQWMTAGSGLVHDEFHSETYSRAGGEFHMVQLWVNLPAKDKMTPPHYQAISTAEIPRVDVNGASVRLIAGQLRQGDSHFSGPANTYTPMNVWDVKLSAHSRISLPQPEGWTTLLLVQGGRLSINGSDTVGKAQLVVLSRSGSALDIHASEDAQCLLLSGEPIQEPVFGYGPFVMNTEQEIRQAFTDFHSGKFGTLPVA